MVNRLPKRIDVYIGCASRPSPSDALMLEARAMMLANASLGATSLAPSFIAFYEKRNFTLLSPHLN